MSNNNDILGVLSRSDLDLLGPGIFSIDQRNLGGLFAHIADEREYRDSAEKEVCGPFICLSGDNGASVIPPSKKGCILREGDLIEVDSSGTVKIDWTDMFRRKGVSMKALFDIFVDDDELKNGLDSRFLRVLYDLLDGKWVSSESLKSMPRTRVKAIASFLSQEVGLLASTELRSEIDFCKSRAIFSEPCFDCLCLLISLGRKPTEERFAWSFDADRFISYIDCHVPSCYSADANRLAAFISQAAEMGKRPSVLLRCPDGAPGDLFATALADAIQTKDEGERIELRNVGSAIEVIGNSRNYKEAEAGLVRRVASCGDGPIIVYNADTLSKLRTDDGDITEFLYDIAARGSAADRFLGSSVELCNPVVFLESMTEPISRFENACSVEMNLHRLTSEEKLHTALELLDGKVDFADEAVLRYLVDKYALDDGSEGISRVVSIIEAARRAGDLSDAPLEIQDLINLLPPPDPEDHRSWFAEKRASFSSAPESVQRCAEELLGKVLRDEAENKIAKKKLRYLLRALPNGDRLPRLSADKLRKIIRLSHPELGNVDELSAVLSMSFMSTGHVPAILLVGPAGTGKTTVMSSLAGSIGLPFKKLDMPGVDTNDLYGGSINPSCIGNYIAECNGQPGIIALDEVDKVACLSNQALCSMLDRGVISDFYTGAEIDISNNLIVLTANALDLVSPYIIDRCTVVEIPGYTPYQKVRVAKATLLRRSFDELGMKPVPVQDAAIKYLSNVDDEAGLRSFERSLRKLIAASNESEEIGLEQAKRVAPFRRPVFQGIKVVMPRGGSKGGAAMGLIHAICKPSSDGKKGISCSFASTMMHTDVLQPIESALIFSGVGALADVVVAACGVDDLVSSCYSYSTLGIAVASALAITGREPSVLEGVAFSGMIDAAGNINPVSADYEIKLPFVIARAGSYGVKRLVCHPSVLAVDGAEREARYSGVELVCLESLKEVMFYVEGLFETEALLQACSE